MSKYKSVYKRINVCKSEFVYKSAYVFANMIFYMWCVRACVCVYVQVGQLVILIASNQENRETS